MSQSVCFFDRQAMTAAIWHMAVAIAMAVDLSHMAMVIAMVAVRAIWADFIFLHKNVCSWAVTVFHEPWYIHGAK